MSKMTTKGNARTVGATNYTPTAAKGKGKAKTDKSTPVPARNIGKKGSAKASGKGLPAFLQKKGKK